MALAALTPPMPRWQDRVLGPDRRQGPGAPQRFFSPQPCRWRARGFCGHPSRSRELILAPGTRWEGREGHGTTRPSPPKRAARGRGRLLPAEAGAGVQARSLPSHGSNDCIRAMEGLRVNCTGEEVDGAYWISRSVSAVAIGPRRGANKTFCHLPSDLLPSPHHTPLPSLLSLPLFVHSSSHSPMPTPVAVRPHVRTTF